MIKSGRRVAGFLLRPLWWGALALLLSCRLPEANAAEAVGGVRARLLAGEAVVFTAGQSEVERTIPAGWLADAARRGAAVNVVRAIISDALDLRHAAVTNRFRLAQCTFKAATDCSFAVFEQGADFTDSQFVGEARFTGVVARRATLLRGTTFSGRAVFTDATAEDVFLAESAAFLGRETRFDRARFHKTAAFGPGPGQPAASFSGNVSFAEARFGGAVDFNRVRFGGGTNTQVSFAETLFERVTTFRGADFRGNTSFNTAQFKGTAAFGAEGDEPGQLPAARFTGPVTFGSVQFGGEADFTGVQFVRPVPVNFDGCSFSDYARFGGTRFAGGAQFSKAKFAGLADFEAVQFEGEEASFQDSELAGRTSFVGGQFAGGADFRNVRFGGETAFNGVKFEDAALFTYAHFSHTVSFGEIRSRNVPGATFASMAVFSGVKFDLDAFFEKVRFNSTNANETVSFSAALFGAETAFDGAQFHGDANFVRATFTSSATFKDTSFLHPEQPVQFNSIKAGKTMNFTGARFAGPLDFVAAEAVGPVQFASVLFEGDAMFNAMSVERHAVFGPIGTNRPTHFAALADFIAVKIGGQLDLAAARFDREALFRGANLQRGLILSWRPGTTGAVQAAEFRARADFRNVFAGERVQLAGVTFHDQAAFDSTKWDVPMSFEDVRFRKGASVTRAAFPQGANFSGARFDGTMDLTDSSFRTLRLTSLSKWTDGPIELRGSTYEEFIGNVSALLQAFARADRPVLTRLERSLRQVGQDDEADEVYLENQRRERRQCWVDHKYGEWFFRMLYGVLGNYGVRPYRLLVFSAILVWMGALVFKVPGAVTHKDKEARTAPITTFDAVALSICYFLPVEFPLEEEWNAATKPLTYHLPVIGKPVQVRPAAIANFVLRLSGWIVVPLALAAVTGLLKTNG